jgi:protoheme IX farnesyltransferase
VTRFRILAATTVAMTLLLVTIGVFVRATGSGLGCPDWPFCYGQILPPLDDAKAWIEWTHRTVAALLGVLIVLQAIVAFVDHRDRRSLLWPSIAAVGLVGFQAWLGKVTVETGNSGESVTAHLASAMALLGLLVYILMRSAYPARFGGAGASQRFTLLAGFGAIAVYAVLLFGSHLTATGGALAFPDWPLMDGGLAPTLSDAPTTAHVLHRWVAGLVGLLVAAIAVVAWRGQRDHPTMVRLAVLAAALYAVQVVVGGLQVLLVLEAWTQTLHVALGAGIWACLVALTTVAYYEARLEGARIAAPDGGGGTGERRLSDTVAAYVALTKPRIIELLLVTTIPAMVLATRDVPGMSVPSWLWLAVWTLVGGTLAAGAANAMNQYLERDIDILMVRTRRRPLPAHTVEPDRAVVFGLALTILSFVILWQFVNLLAAFLTLVAISFYVVVYTVFLKRTTPQNIVIGGAAGALPPVIGWAAVTGSIAPPAIILFLLVFYWTPPHFWALSLRLRNDYAAAGVPMLPVVRGIPETARQIVLYTTLTVAFSLALFAVARMGLVYFGAAIVLGAIFLWQAAAIWRRASSEEASIAGAVRLYRYSITYLTLLSAAVVVDSLILLAAG